MNRRTLLLFILLGILILIQIVMLMLVIVAPESPEAAALIPALARVTT